MSSLVRNIRRNRFFPIVPFVPMAIIGGFIALEAFTLARLRRLTRSVDALVEAQLPSSV